MHKGKHRNVVVTAIAREMIAYIWAISREVVLPVVDVKLRIARSPHEQFSKKGFELSHGVKHRVWHNHRRR